MLRRGFKSEGERIATELRRGLGLEDGEPLDPAELARHLGYEVRSADELVPRRELERLHEIQEGAFSACTFKLPNGRIVIVCNPLNAPARKRSDISHELAHLILDHELSRLERIEELSFLSCDANQEEEANWLGGCLLLPRSELLADCRRGLAAESIAKTREISLAMVRFRLNTSGVLLQVRRERAKRRP